MVQQKFSFFINNEFVNKQIDIKNMRLKTPNTKLKIEPLLHVLARGGGGINFKLERKAFSKYVLEL